MCAEELPGNLAVLVALAAEAAPCDAGYGEPASSSTTAMVVGREEGEIIAGGVV